MNTLSGKFHGDSVQKTSNVEWLSRALTVASTWNDTDELLDAVYWGRQFFSVFYGCILGLFGVTGFWSIILYFLLCYKLCKVYVQDLQKVDLETLGGILNVNSEGCKEAFAAFMVSWIAAYTARIS